MRELRAVEVEEVSGGGWFVAIVAVACGFAFGGPVGAGAAAASMLAATGAKNLEHMKKTGEIPTINQVIN